MEPYSHILPPNGLVIDADILTGVIYRILLSYTAYPHQLVPHLHGHLLFLHVPDSPDEIMLHTPNYEGKELFFPYYAMVPAEAKIPIRELAIRAGHMDIPLPSLTHLSVGIPPSRPLEGVYSGIRCVSIVSVPQCKAHPLRLNPILYEFGNMLRWFDTTQVDQRLMVAAMLEATSVHLTKRLILRVISGRDTPGIEIYIDHTVGAPAPVQNPMVLDLDHGKTIQFDPVPIPVSMKIDAPVHDNVVSTASSVDKNPLPEQILEEVDEDDLERIVPMAPITTTERMVPTSSIGVVEEKWDEEWVEEDNRGDLLLEEEEKLINEDSEESPVEETWAIY